MDSKRLVAILGALLLAAVIVSFVVLWLLPTQEDITAPPQPTSIPEQLDVSFLQRGDYNQLDVGLLQQGALPVPPPPGVGKANPFL